MFVYGSRSGKSEGQLAARHQPSDQRLDGHRRPVGHLFQPSQIASLKLTTCPESQKQKGPPDVQAFLMKKPNNDIVALCVMHFV